MKIKEYIESNDPLSEDVVDFLINFKEETDLVDFKLTFDDEQKKWLELVKDIISFANSDGGYIIFGIEDLTYKLIGLDDSIRMLLMDVNKIQQKINSYIEPHIDNIRVKSTKYDSKNVLLLFIPESKGKTHIIFKQGSYTDNNNKTKNVFSQGNIYVRKGSSNELCNARDLDNIIEKRINNFKEMLFDKIAQVVYAPIDTKLTFSKVVSDNEKHFKISDSVDAIPVSSMSFTVPPTTNEERILGFIAQHKSDYRVIPPEEFLWDLYHIRDSLVINPEQKLYLAKFSIIQDVPFFFWIKDIEKNNIKSMIESTFIEYQDINTCSRLLNLSAFLGSRFHKKIYNMDSNKKRRFKPQSLNIQNDPKSNFNFESIKEKIKKNGLELAKQEIEIEFNTLLEEYKNLHLLDRVYSKYCIMGYDCYLYSQKY